MCTYTLKSVPVNKIHGMIFQKSNGIYRIENENLYIY